MCVCGNVCALCVCVCAVCMCVCCSCVFLHSVFFVQGPRIDNIYHANVPLEEQRQAHPFIQKSGFLHMNFFIRTDFHSLICFYVHGSRGCSRGTDGSGQHKAGEQHRVWRGETSCCIADWCVTCYTFLINASWIVPCPELHMLTPGWLDQNVFKYLSWTPNYLKKVSEAAYISEVSM